MVINNCSSNDDAAYSVVAGDEKCTTELFVKGTLTMFFININTLCWLTNPANLFFSFILHLSELPIKIIKGIEPVKTTVNERIELECEVSEEGAQVKW